MKLFLKAMHDGKELHAYNRQWFRQAMRLPLVMASYMALLDLMIVCHRLDMLRLPLVMASYMALLDLMIACRCLDMPPPAIRTQAESVWLMRYAIKHAHTAFLKMSIKEQYLNHFLVRAKEVDRLLLFDLAL
jgi:hypothetical protein